MPTTDDLPTASARPSRRRRRVAPDITTRRPHLPLAIVLFCAALLAAATARAQGPSGGPDDSLGAALTHAAERILLPERCGECHAAEFEVWQDTAHATGFDTLHRTERAREIYGNLGLRLIKRATDETTPACLSCHYTPVLRRGLLRAGAGVTCESCHGPAREWIGIHNDYGVAESDFQVAARRETEAHRTQRIADSVAAGMRRPSQIYEVAANCFGCHTVPNEELVNRAGHSTGSDFELVAWSGRIRHNFLESYKTADGRTNAERPRAWKRVLYVVGRALDLEYSLRGVAAATEDDLYVAAMSDRVGAAIDELLTINERIEIEAVQTLLGLAESVDPTVGNRDRLLAAADAVQAATRRFIAGADGAALAALDPLWDPALEEAAAPARVVTDAAILPDALPVVDEQVRRGPEGAVDAAGATEAPNPTAADEDAGDWTAAPDSARTADAAGVREASPARDRIAAPAPVVTLTRPPWRDLPAHDFVKVPCGRCHSAQEKWWRRDPHSTAGTALRAGEPRAIEIARAYGVSDDDVARGTQTCMWCHGTVVGNPSRRVRAGVGCQRCHGPGADYLEPHETVSHAESVRLGLTDLPDPAVQASTCAGCHYVTDPGLIAAGHPAGADFDIVARREEIEHWGDAFGRDALVRDPGALAAAHARVIADRGPVPAGAPDTVAAASGFAPSAATEASTVRRDAGVGVTTAPAERSTAGRNRRTVAATTPVRPPRSGPPRERAAAPSVSAAVPALDALEWRDGASVEEILQALRGRIEDIYRTLEPRPTP